MQKLSMRRRRFWVCEMDVNTGCAASRSAIAWLCVDMGYCGVWEGREGVDGGEGMYDLRMSET